MGKFSGVLLYSDYDDTLIGSDHAICRRNREGIEYFISEGGTFGVATGRAWSAFIKHWEAIPMNAPTVLGNGSSIYDFPNKKLLVETHLSEDTLSHLEELIAVFPDLGFEVYHGEEIFAWNPNEVTRSHMALVGADYTTCHPRQMSQPWNKIIFEQDTPLLEQVQRYVSGHWREDYEIIFSNRYLLECTGKGCHKGSMVARIAKERGFAPEHIYCVGDNQNDIPMLAISAIPFAPANCAQAVKDWGAVLVSSCDIGAIGDIIAILEEKYR